MLIATLIDFCDGLRAVRRHRLEAGRRRNGVRRVVRCDCWREQVGAAAAAPTRASRSAISTARSTTSPPTTSRSSARSSRRAACADRFPSPDLREQGRLLLERPPGVGKTHLAVAVLKQVIGRAAARGLFYDTRDLLRVIRSTYDPSIRTTEIEILRPVMTRGSARARRPRRREDVRVGRRDDEPDRQHALQRAPADDLHVELRGHSRRHRSELAARAASASGCARGCTRCASSSRSTAPTTASCRPTAASDDLVTLWKMRKKAPLPSPRAGRQARAQLREPAVRDGRADLKWPGGRAGS